MATRKNIQALREEKNFTLLEINKLYGTLLKNIGSFSSRISNRVNFLFSLIYFTIQEKSDVLTSILGHF